MNFSKILESFSAQTGHTSWANGIESNDILKEIMNSILRITRFKEGQNSRFMPKTFIRVQDFEQYGLLNFAFNNPYDSLATRTPLSGFQPDFMTLAGACAYVHMEFFKRFTLIEKPIYSQRVPSKYLIISFIYLHNLLIFCKKCNAGIDGMIRKGITDFFSPFHEFYEYLKNNVWQLDEIIILHASILNFFDIYAEQCLNQTKLLNEFHCRYLDIYQEMQEKDPLILVLIEQLIESSPLSRFWFIARSPFHFKENTQKWFDKCDSLFQRDALPLLIMLTDYLAHSIFKLSQSYPEQPKSDAARFNIAFNPFALKSVSEFLKISELAEKSNEYIIYFRLLIYYHLFQSHWLYKLKNSNIFADSDNKNCEILKEFLHTCTWMSSISRFSVNLRSSDKLKNRVLDLLNRVIIEKFGDQCDRIASSIMNLK